MVDSRGEVALSVKAGLGFPLRSPLAGAPTVNREYYPYYPNQIAAGGSIAVLSATGSSLIWSFTWTVVSPPLRLLRMDRSYAAVMSGALEGKIGHSAVWHLPMPMNQEVSIDSVANAFSGFSDAIAPGSLVV